MRRLDSDKAITSYFAREGIVVVNIKLKDN